VFKLADQLVPKIISGAKVSASRGLAVWLRQAEAVACLLRP